MNQGIRQELKNLQKENRITSELSASASRAKAEKCETCDIMVIEPEDQKMSGTKDDKN